MRTVVQCLDHEASDGVGDSWVELEEESQLTDLRHVGHRRVPECRAETDAVSDPRRHLVSIDRSANSGVSRHTHDRDSEGDAEAVTHTRLMMGMRSFTD